MPIAKTCMLKPRVAWNPLGRSSYVVLGTIARPLKLEGCYESMCSKRVDVLKVFLRIKLNLFLVQTVANAKP